jgi:hypothetical protein
VQGKMNENANKAKGFANDMGNNLMNKGKDAVETSFIKVDEVQNR